MPRGITAGLRYGVEAFALGFALGIVRVTLLTPLLGALPAVLIECPIILVAMAGRAASIIALSGVDQTSQRAIMGATGFVVLMACEFLFGIALGASPHEWASALTTPSGASGLTAQILFGALPLLVRAPRSF